MSELILKYKIKGEESDSYALYDNKTNTFCHVISNVLSNYTDDNNNIEGNNEPII